MRPKTEESYERNKQLTLDIINGCSFIEAGRNYGIHPTTVREVVLRVLDHLDIKPSALGQPLPLAMQKRRDELFPLVNGLPETAAIRARSHQKRIEDAEAKEAERVERVRAAREKAAQSLRRVEVELCLTVKQYELLDSVIERMIKEKIIEHEAAIESMEELREIFKSEIRDTREILLVGSRRRWPNMFTDDRCKELMKQVGLPNSQSLMRVLMQVANEVEQKTIEREGLIWERQREEERMNKEKL